MFSPDPETEEARVVSRLRWAAAIYDGAVRHLWILGIALLSNDIWQLFSTSGQPPEHSTPYFLWFVGLSLEIWILGLLIRMIRMAIAQPRTIGVLATLTAHVIFIDAAALRGAGIMNMATNKLISDIPISVYLSTITFTSMGYGDFVPATDFGRLVAAIESFSGYLILGILIAVLIEGARQKQLALRELFSQQQRRYDEIKLLSENVARQNDEVRARYDVLQKLATSKGINLPKLTPGDK